MALGEFQSKPLIPLLELARAVSLLPLETDSREQAIQLSIDLDALNVTDKWKRDVVGRLKVRIGKFDAWFESEADEVQRGLETRTNRLLSGYRSGYQGDPNLQSDAAPDQRKELQRVADLHRAQAERAIENGATKSQYWWSYIISRSYVNEIESAIENDR